MILLMYDLIQREHVPHTDTGDKIKKEINKITGYTVSNSDKKHLNFFFFFLIKSYKKTL